MERLFYEWNILVLKHPLTLQERIGNKNQERYAQRNKERVWLDLVWIPKQFEQELKDKALELRQKHEELQRGAQVNLFHSMVIISRRKTMVIRRLKCPGPGFF